MIGLPDDKWGERVHAVIVLHDGATLREADLQEWSKERLAGYKRPRSYAFIAESEMPRNATGKVLHRELKKKFAGPADKPGQRLIAARLCLPGRRHARIRQTSTARGGKAMKVLYTATATARGGREGHVQSDDGVLDLALSMPKELGGSGRRATNPEQLFAAGYAACFENAILRAAREAKIKSRTPSSPLPSASAHARKSLRTDVP